MDSRLIALVTGIAALTVTGCGEEKLDVNASKAGIKRAVEVQIGGGVRTVDCPGEVEVRAQAMFPCVVTGADRTKGIARVTQTDGRGTLSVSAPFVHGAEQSIETDLRTRVPGATVDCQDIIVVQAGGKFTCKAKLATGIATVTGTLTGAGDAFTYNVKTQQ